MKALLIPSAILVPYEMRAKMGYVPSCLFPLHDKTMLQHIFEKYKKKVDLIYIVVYKGKEKVYDYISLKKLPIQIIELDSLQDLGHTISYGIKYILDKNPDTDYLYINFADTLLSNPIDNSNNDRIFYAKEPYSEEWTYFQHNNGVLSNIVDKQLSENFNEEKGDVFTGVFEISHIKTFCSFFSKKTDFDQQNIDSFYIALEKYSKSYPFECILSGRWFDVGHTDRYFQAQTNVASRSFNFIDIDSERGILTKHSENREKLIDEIEWYLRLPKQLKYLTPRIYDYSINQSNPYISMEYYGYNTVHEKYVFGNIQKSLWRKIFKKIHFVLKDMERFSTTYDEDKQTKAMYEIYIKKTIDRLETLRHDKNFHSFFDNPIIINKKLYSSLNWYIINLPSIIEKQLLISNQKPFCVIHGDLCFANILVESNLCFLRFIDPRGKFGDYDIYGDQRYEIAKLLHSIDGNYDYIIEDLFSVSVENNSIMFDIPKINKQILKIFKEVFADMLHDYNEILLIESLLFLSMIPLHNDAVNRQYAMLATGIQLLNAAILNSN